jgi:hypothetical protein
VSAIERVEHHSSELRVFKVGGRNLSLDPSLRRPVLTEQAFDCNGVYRFVLLEIHGP